MSASEIIDEISEAYLKLESLARLYQEYSIESLNPRLEERYRKEAKKLAHSTWIEMCMVNVHISELRDKLMMIYSKETRLGGPCAIGHEWVFKEIVSPGDIRVEVCAQCDAIRRVKMIRKTDDEGYPKIIGYEVINDKKRGDRNAKAT